MKGKGTINSLSENMVEGMRGDRDLGNFTITDAETIRADSPRIDELLQYFTNKTAGRRLVCRADVSPRDLKKFLPEIFMFQIIYENGKVKDLLVQLIGTTVANFYGEITGMTVREGAPSPLVTERIMAACHRVLETRAPAVAEASSLSEEKNHLRVRVLYIPMSEDGTHIDRIFGHAHVSLRSAAE